MARYAIFEGNMERLEKKALRIQNKCRKYGCDFCFEKVGEEFRPFAVIDENGNAKEEIRRFVIVEAEGVAIINDWKFVASVEHTEKGNIFHKACDDEIPERYFNAEPVCEHCNTNHYRKETFIVKNVDSGEFKQVGRSCLNDFTNGMSVEAVSSYVSMFNDLIQGEVYEGSGWSTRYIDTEKYMECVAETIRHFGYVKSDSFGSTKEKALDFYGYNRGWLWPEAKEAVREEIEKVGFDFFREENVELARKVREWVGKMEDKGDYVHNLKVACGLDYVEIRNAGILASAFPVFDRELEYQAKKREEDEKAKNESENSEYVGNVGDRIEVDVVDSRCLTSWETMYGVSFLYKFVGKDGNVYLWKTGKSLEEVKSVKGTVKAHKEFRGVRQTELTRCKVA